MGSGIHVHGSICDWTQIIEFTAELRGCENPDAETHDDDHEKHPLSTAFRYGGKALMATCVCPPGAPPVTKPEGSSRKATQRDGPRNGRFQAGLRFLIRTVARQVCLVHRILHASILQWLAISSSRGSSRPRDRTCVSCIAGGFFTI